MVKTWPSRHHYHPPPNCHKSMQNNNTIVEWRLFDRKIQWEDYPRYGGEYVKVAIVLMLMRGICLFVCLLVCSFVVLRASPPIHAEPFTQHTPNRINACVCVCWYHEQLGLFGGPRHYVLWGVRSLKNLIFVVKQNKKEWNSFTCKTISSLLMMADTDMENYFDHRQPGMRYSEWKLFVVVIDWCLCSYCPFFGGVVWFGLWLEGNVCERMRGLLRRERAPHYCKVETPSCH